MDDAGKEKMVGVRKDNPDSLIPANGEYGRDVNGDWFGMTPNGHLAGLRLHNVIEHEDGTITVAPSIGVRGDRQYDAGIRVSAPNGEWLWHGYLERGVWREV